VGLKTKNIISKNKISIDILKDVVTQVSSKFQEIKDLLTPHIGIMTVDKSKTLPKISNKSTTFVNKMIEYTLTNPKFIPSVMDIEECKKDYTVNQILLIECCITTNR